MAFKLDDEKNWGEFVHEHALDEMADQVEANRVKNVEQDQRLDEHDQHLAKLDEDLATETRERKAADEAEKQAREAADEAEKTAREQADEAEKTAREAADEAEKEAREQADADEAQAREQADEAEKTAREEADQTEKTAREAADEAEKEAREKADADEVQARQTADTAEQTAREQTDQILQTQVTANTTKNTEQDTRLGSIESKNADQDNRLANNDEKDAEQDTRLTNNDTRDNQQDARLDGLETKNTTQDSRLSALEAKPDEDIYPTSLTIEDNTLKLSQNDSAKNLSVSLPKASATDDEAREELAIQRQLHEIEDNVVYAQNQSAVHDTSYFKINKFGGEFATKIEGDSGSIPNAIYDLVDLSALNGGQSEMDEGALNFLHTSGASFYSIFTKGQEGGALQVNNISDMVTSLGTHDVVVYNHQGQAGALDTLLTLAPIGTVLYSNGYNEKPYMATGQWNAGVFLFNLITRENLNLTGSETVAELKSKLADYLMPDGYYHIPLIYTPIRKNLNFTELDVPEGLKNQVGQIPTTHELRLYQIESIN